jgi:hypothetical protein
VAPGGALQRLRRRPWRARLRRPAREAGVTVRLSQPTIAAVAGRDRVVGVLSAATRWRPATSSTAPPMRTWRAPPGRQQLGLREHRPRRPHGRHPGLPHRRRRLGRAPPRRRRAGRAYAYVDERVAYGHFGGHPAAYRPENDGLRLRGLNLGRQDDGSVLVNALLIYGVDPLDPSAATKGGRAPPRRSSASWRGSRDLPGFERARAGGVADALYVRQTRHLDADCQLTIDDVSTTSSPTPTWRRAATRSTCRRCDRATTASSSACPTSTAAGCA